MATTIQCHCGRVKVELEGEPVAQFYCHCDDCQKVHCAAYVPVALYRITATKIVAGDPVLWKFKVTPRATCRDCGTRLFAEPPGMGMRGVVANLLPAGSFKPQFHIQCQHAVIPLRDDLPHYKGFPGMFGGSDECTPW